MNVRKIYRDLYREFGPQHWWPRHKGKKRPGFDPRFEIMVGAVLTQNTAWTNVERAIEALYRERLLDARAIAKVRLSKLKRLIRPAGYFNQKAKKLKILARWYCHPERQRRIPRDPSVPLLPQDDTMKLRAKLLSLWGVGKETADSILLYAYHRPIFVIDAYTRRLCKMHKIVFKDYDEYRAYFEDHLPRSAKLFNEYHALIVVWGKAHAKSSRKLEQRTARGRHTS
jgi:endonuclease-3 related protein